MGFWKDSFTVKQHHICKFRLGWMLLLFALCSIIPSWMDLSVLLNDQIAFGGQIGITFLSMWLNRSCVGDCLKVGKQCECEAGVLSAILSSWVVPAQAVLVAVGDPTNPLQSSGCSQSDSAWDGSSLVCSRLLRDLFQFLLKSEDFLSKTAL